MEEEKAIKIIHDLKNSSNYVYDKHILDMKIDTILSVEAKTKHFELLLLPLVQMIKKYKLSYTSLVDEPIGANFEVSVPFAFWNPYIDQIYDLSTFKHQNNIMIKTYLSCENLTQDCILLISAEQFQKLLKYFDSIQNIIKLIVACHKIRPVLQPDATTKWLYQFYKY